MHGTSKSPSLTAAIQWRLANENKGVSAEGHTSMQRFEELLGCTGRKGLLHARKTQKIIINK